MGDAFSQRQRNEPSAAPASEEYSTMRTHQLVQELSSGQRHGRCCASEKNSKEQAKLLTAFVQGTRRVGQDDEMSADMFTSALVCMM
jgi:hypothetical protein